MLTYEIYDKCLNYRNKKYNLEKGISRLRNKQENTHD